MNESLQKVLDTLYDAVSKESEATAVRVRDAFRSVIQQLETPREQIKKLEARIESLEREVADLRSTRSTRSIDSPAAD